MQLQSSTGEKLVASGNPIAFSVKTIAQIMGCLFGKWLVLLEPRLGNG